MTERGAGCWESRLSGSEGGRVATRTTGEIMWHRRETRRQTEKTNIALPSGECPVYSKNVWTDRSTEMVRTDAIASRMIGAVGSKTKPGIRTTSLRIPLSGPQAVRLQLGNQGAVEMQEARAGKCQNLKDNKA